MAKYSNMYASASSPWMDPEMLNQTVAAGGLKGMYSNLKANPMLQKAGAFGKGALKAAPYIGGGLMAAQGIGDLMETGGTSRSNEDLIGQIGLMRQGTPMLNEFLDPNTMRELENLQRRGGLETQTKGASAIKGALGELPGAAVTALGTLIFSLLTGGAGIPLGLAFGAGQLGLGATKGLKQAEETEKGKLENLYAQLAEAQRISRASRMPATQNFNMK